MAGYSRWLAGAPELSDNFAPRMLEITICTIIDTDAIVPLNGEPEAIENLARAIELLKQT